MSGLDDLQLITGRAALLFYLGSLPPFCSENYFTKAKHELLSYRSGCVLGNLPAISRTDLSMYSVCLFRLAVYLRTCVTSLGVSMHAVIFLGTVAGHLALNGYMTFVVFTGINVCRNLMWVIVTISLIMKKLFWCLLYGFILIRLVGTIKSTGFGKHLALIGLRKPLIF